MSEQNQTPAPDYVIVPTTPPPSDYPFENNEDDYSTASFHYDYNHRKNKLFEFIQMNPAPTNTKAPYYELGRLAAGGTPHLGVFISAIEYIENRKDCADFVLHSILRLLYQFSDNIRISNDVKTKAAESVLSFKYWPDEEGLDSMCTWTENHYILFASAGFLAGKLYPTEIFSNSGQTGAEKQELNRKRIIRWLNFRFFTGFSEWLSNIYYDEDLVALLNLVDFCDDEEIQTKAASIIDLILFEMALNNHKGVFGSTHGRSYEYSKKWASQESTTDTSKLLFGRGQFTTEDNMSAITFALSERYSPPKVILDIAQDVDRPEMLHRQRSGINLNQISWWNIKPKNYENGMLLLTQETYFHPRTANLFYKMMNKFSWWNNYFFQPLRKYKSFLRFLYLFRLLPTIGRIFKHDICRNTREEVNIYTYRTPDYMLSSAQDYKKGFGGDQQHIWQATLGPNAVCFTTHPARLSGNTPNYWVGSGTLPRVAQFKNVVIAIYKISKSPSLYVPNELFYTHAWFPKDQFEEVVEQNGWIFARLGNGFLALYSQNPYEWRELPGEDQNREVIVHKRNNIWICELGRYETDGDFSEFRKRISKAKIITNKLRAKYESPSLGLIEFGWSQPLRVNKNEISISDYPRFANPYTQVDFPSEKISINFDDQYLILDWMNGLREIS
jgi:hypothetical protein